MVWEALLRERIKKEKSIYKKVNEKFRKKRNIGE
jgi:hypothetical protein